MTLQAHNLGVAFDESWIFRSVSLSMNSANRLALVGPSGSGKSILLKSLAMLHPFDEGSIEWDGQVVSGSSVPAFRSKVMYVPQRSADADGTVEDFLKTPFSFSVHAGRTFDRSQADRHLQTLGRDSDFLAKPQRELSGGERQIAALVRSLLLDPKVLLLDEPTSAMDGTSATSAEQLIDKWCLDNAGRSTLWVTHDLHQARRVSQQVIPIGELTRQ